jgi:hypothetical protein
VFVRETPVCSRNALYFACKQAEYHTNTQIKVDAVIRIRSREHALQCLESNQLRLLVSVSTCVAVSRSRFVFNIDHQAHTHTDI